jgi:predicted Fe-Mo cluster-binding NifX family protein
MRPNDVVKGDGWTVKAVGVAHFGPQLISYGFRLDSPEGSFVYSGDSGPCASMERLAEGWGDLSRATVARKSAALRRFFAFLADEGLRADDPGRALPRPGSARPLPRTLSSADVDRLFEAIEARIARDPQATFGLGRPALSPEELAVVIDGAGLSDDEMANMLRASLENARDDMETRLLAESKVEARRSVLAVQKVTPADARPCHWADWLAGEGVAFLLAAGIGNAPTQRMNAHGIAVHSGIYKSDPDEIVADFMSGTLAYAQNSFARADGDDHHHHDHDHDHDHGGCGCDHH